MKMGVVRTVKHVHVFCIYVNCFQIYYELNNCDNMNSYFENNTVLH